MIRMDQTIMLMQIENGNEQINTKIDLVTLNKWSFRVHKKKRQKNFVEK